MTAYLGADGGIWSITFRFLADSSTLAPWQITRLEPSETKQFLDVACENRSLIFFLN